MSEFESRSRSRKEQRFGGWRSNDRAAVGVQIGGTLENLE